MRTFMNAMSIDVEEWYDPELVKNHVPATDRSSMLQRSIRPLLEALSKHRTLCTFFVLGRVARQYPDLIRQLHAEGHEIACHGMTHIPLWHLTPMQFRVELREFRQTIYSIDPSIRIAGFRAPTFSLDSTTAWALRILADEGFAYDSSIFPFRNHVYGVSDAPLVPYKPDPDDITKHSEAGVLWEFPMTVVTLRKVRIPVSGGLYLRVFPRWFTVMALRRVNRQRPFMLYCHPWECDPLVPHVKIGFINSLITYTGTNGTIAKLNILLDEFFCTRIDVALETYYGRH